MSNYNRYHHNYKRKNFEDSSHDNDYKRQRTNSEINVVAEDEVENVIYKLGEQEDMHQNKFSIEHQIEKATSFVTTMLVEKKTEVVNTILECAYKLPEKLTIYTTFIGLLNVRNPNFTEELVNSIASSLKENLKLGHFFIVHRLIRFVSDLINVNVISTRSLVKIYQNFVETATEDNSPQVRTDFYVYCILSSIPWIARLLYEKHGPQFDQILESIKTYIGKRQKDYLPLLKVWSNDDPHPQEEYLDCIWIQIKKLEDNDWKENQIYRPYTSFENTLMTGTPVEFPNIVPPEYSDSAIYPLPRVIFRMFDYTDVPEEFILPGAHSIERFLVEEQLHSVINTYYLDRKQCANKLLKQRITNKIPLNYMIVEIILGQLFTLPKPAQIEVFYGSLLLELCRIEPNFIPLVLAQATELLFERIDHMKTSCVERFSSWFAYHLSNFQYKWSWEDWNANLDKDLESPKNKFLRENLVRCMRLAYHQRIVDIIPESMSNLIPENPKPTYKYVSEEAANLEGTLVANKLLELFKERALPEDIFQLLRDIPNESDDPDAQNPLKIEVFTSTLLYFGSKSFSHAFAALAKYHMIFQMIVDSEESQLVVLKSLHEVWKNHQQMIVVMVDKMLKTQIVNCASVANFIFSDSMRQDLTRFYCWEILHSTVNRMSKQVDKLQHEYNQLNEKYRKPSFDNDTIHSDVTEEELEQKLDTLNSLKEQQKQLFLIVIKRFITILTEHLNKPKSEPDENSVDTSEHWIKWIGERFEDFLITHNEEILPYFEDFRNELVSSETHKYVTKVFKMYAALKK